MLKLKSFTIIAIALFSAVAALVLLVHLNVINSSLLLSRLYNISKYFSVTSPTTSSKPLNSDVFQKPVKYTTENLGINLPWLNLHNGNEAVNWLNTKYNARLIDDDLTSVQSMGVTKIRSFCQMESVFSYLNGRFIINEQYASNLDDFLTRAEKHNISVICVMGDGNYEGTPKSLDGHMHLELLQTTTGLSIYQQAYIDYINRFKAHNNILMWDMVNEPYSSLTWSSEAKKLHITQQQMHMFLLMQYKTIKPLVGKTFVGFSDLEEEEQDIYQLYSNSNTREEFVDDCTDVYAMHIYRASSSQIADFRNLNSKPKWVVELGSYNYYDPEASSHPVPAANELYNSDEDYIAFVQISKKLLNSGFSLIMPWAFTGNDGFVKHNSDGTHTFYRLAQFIQKQLSPVISPTPKQ